MKTQFLTHLHTTTIFLVFLHSLLHTLYCLLPMMKMMFFLSLVKSATTSLYLPLSFSMPSLHALL